MKPSKDERADLLVRLAEASGVMCIGTHPLHSVEQQLLERLDVLILAADSRAFLASGSFVGLFALIAEHSVVSFGLGCAKR